MPDRTPRRMFIAFLLFAHLFGTHLCRSSYARRSRYRAGPQSIDIRYNDIGPLSAWSSRKPRPTFGTLFSHASAESNQARRGWLRIDLFHQIAAMAQYGALVDRSLVRHL